MRAAAPEGADEPARVQQAPGDGVLALLSVHDVWANPSQSLGAVPKAAAVPALPASGARRSGPYADQEQEAKRQRALGESGSVAAIAALGS